MMRIVVVSFLLVAVLAVAAHAVSEESRGVVDATEDDLIPVQISFPMIGDYDCTCRSTSLIGEDDHDDDDSNDDEEEEEDDDDDGGGGFFSGSGQTSNSDQLTAFLSDPEFLNREFYMVNINTLREKAVYRDGRATDLTGFEANQLYASYVLPELERIGAYSVFSGQIQMDFQQPTHYASVRVVRYPNSTAFQQIISAPAFRENVQHKEAALEHNFVLACEREPGFVPPAMENPPFPPNATNLPVAMFLVNDYRDYAVYADGDSDPDNTRTGREAADVYAQNGGPIVAAYGDW